MLVKLKEIAKINEFFNANPYSICKMDERGMEDH